MKTNLLFLGFIFAFNVSQAQGEIETLERMYQMVDSDRKNEDKAQEIVQNYYYKTKDKIRENSGKLTQEEYNKLISYQNTYWRQITDAIRNYYGGSYYEFYSQQKDNLEKYREDVLDLLYKFIYN